LVLREGREMAHRISAVGREMVADFRNEGEIER